MKTFLFIVIIFLGHWQAYSQSHISISGRVTNANSGEKIPFATVSLKNHPVGTITNMDGEFNIYIPKDYTKDTLIVSHLGFGSFKLPVNIAAGEDPLDVSLDEKAILLASIEVNEEELTATEIIRKALDKLKDNFNSKPFIMKGFFRDVREQNDKTVYLAEASVDIQDPGFLPSGDRKKRFFLKGVRASDTRINDLLSRSLLNSGNALNVVLEHNFWLNSLKHSFKKREFSIEDVVTKDGQFYYVIKGEELASKPSLAEQYKDMQYKLEHRYYVNTETYAIQKVEHRESPIEGMYVGIERPYEGDTLFYSKKGWNQTLEFEEYEGKMYLKYKDVSYTFDIVNQKQESVYLDMDYQFTFVVTDIETDKYAEPEGKKMNTKRSLMVQSARYDAEFWEELSNAKLSPLTEKQLKDLSAERDLNDQFESKRNPSR